MKIQQRLLRSFFIVSILFALTINALPEESVSQISEISQANQSAKLSEKLIKQVFALINQPARIIGDLATLIQEGAIDIKEEDKQKATEKIRSLIKELLITQKTISQIAKDFDNNPTLTQLEKTLSIFNDIIAHLEKYIESDIISYQAFDPQLYHKRTISIDIADLDEALMLEEITKTEKRLKAVQEKSDKAGLKWYNHIYRKIDPAVEWCDKHNVHWKATYVAAALAGFAYVWYKVNPSLHGLTPELKGNFEETTHSYKADDTSLTSYICRTHDTINYYVRSLMGFPPKISASPDEVELTNYANIVHTYVLSNISLEELDLGDADKTATAKMAMAGLGAFLHKHNIQRPTNLFGTIERATMDAVQGHWYLGTALLYTPLQNVIAKGFTDAKNWCTNRLTGLRAWLKGGAYYQRHKNKKGHLGRIEPRYTFDDVIGLDHAKEILNNVVKYMQDPESYDRAGLTPAKGYLLVGPTRTGKTMLAEATAGQIKRALGVGKDLPFYPVEGRWIAAKGNFDGMISIFKEMAPCIVFIDEIDMLNLHREKYPDKTVLLSEVLSTLSGCMNSDPDKQVIIIAATNSPQNMDPSLLERFAVHIPFEYPSFSNRAEFFMNTLEGKGLPIEQFNIMKLAEQTEGCSFERLHKIINNTQFITRDQARPMTQTDLEKSLNTELHGIIYHNYIELPEDDQSILAVHMAGHAIAYSIIEGTGARMSQATIRPVSGKVLNDSILSECLKDVTIPNIMYGHVFTHYKADSLKFLSQKEIERLCMIELAGHIAEKLIFESHHSTKQTCSHHDTTKAFYWARKYSLGGLDEQLIAKSSSMQDDIIKKAYLFMQACEEKMHALLEPRIELIKLVAEGLKGVGTIGGDDMQTLINIFKMLDGKTIEAFVKEMQEAEASTSDATAVHDERGIEETLPAITAAPVA